MFIYINLSTYHDIFDGYLQEVSTQVLDGRIIRCMRIINPDQDEYPGIVQFGTEGQSSVLWRQCKHDGYFSEKN